MKINISSVIENPGSKLEINESGVIDDLRDIYGMISVTGPVVFKGALANVKGMLHLEGTVCCTYDTQCDHCLGKLTKNLQVDIVEDLLEEKQGQENMEEDQFFYRGQELMLDKILSDSIILALPMQHRCARDCAVICAECGKPIVEKGCACSKNQSIDPRLAALNDLLNE